MNRDEIINQLAFQHQLFKDWMIRLSDREYITAPPGKWSPALHLDHICRSVSPVVMAFRLPLFLLRLIFGKANRPSKTYEGLVNKYKDKLAGGGKAVGRFVPVSGEAGKKNILLIQYQHNVNKLCRLVQNIPESDLDNYILPHPLLGKLTLREMLYFTIYHVQHHHNSCLKQAEEIK